VVLQVDGAARGGGREEDTYLLLSLNNVKLPCLVIQRSK